MTHARKRSHLVLAALGAAALGVPATASAGTVELRIATVKQQFGPTTLKETQVLFRAGRGEVNDVTVRRLDSDTVEVHDRAARVVARGQKCTRVDPFTARCTQDKRPANVGGGIATARLLLGDRDDVVEADDDRPVRLSAHGGHGNDLLVGSDVMGDDLDGGGGGRDRLFGKDNSDDLTDGDTSGDADDDVLDAGPGGGIVGYGRRTRGVRIDLATGVGGQRGERDQLRGFRAVFGGRGPDHIDGDDAQDFIYGGPGDDHLDGHGGGDSLRGERGNDRLHGHESADFLQGGAGRDRLRGDGGDDQLHLASRNDILACGAGRDHLSGPQQRILVPGACEELRFRFPEEGPGIELDAHPISATPEALTFTFGCPAPEMAEGPCDEAASGFLAIQSVPGQKDLGSTTVNWRGGGDATMEGGRVPLTPDGRELAGRPEGVLAEHILTVNTSNVLPVRWRTRLRAR